MAPRGWGAGAQPGPRAGGARRVHLRDRVQAPVRRSAPLPPSGLRAPGSALRAPGSLSSADPPRCETSGSAEKEEIARAGGRVGAAAVLGVGVHLAPRPAATSWPLGAGAAPRTAGGSPPPSPRAPPGLCPRGRLPGVHRKGTGDFRGAGGTAHPLTQGLSPGASVGPWTLHGGLPPGPPQAPGVAGPWAGGGKSLHVSPSPGRLDKPNRTFPPPVPPPWAGRGLCGPRSREPTGQLPRLGWGRGQHTGAWYPTGRPPQCPRDCWVGSPHPRLLLPDLPFQGVRGEGPSAGRSGLACPDPASWPHCPPASGPRAAAWVALTEPGSPGPGHPHPAPRRVAWEQASLEQSPPLPGWGT